MNYINKIKVFILNHKIWSIVILTTILIMGIYIHNKLTNTTGEIRYVMGTATTNTIISSITGSGQVSALNQIDLKSNVSGNITYIGVQPGDKVSNGKLLFTIDDTDAQKMIRDAEVNLKSAQISLSKLQIQNSNTNLSSNLSKAYDDGFSTLSNTFLDLPGIMDGLNNIFFVSSIVKNAQLTIDWYESQVPSADMDNVKPYKKSFIDSYNLALKAYTTNLNQYQSVSRASDSTTIENTLTQTYNTTKLISSALKDANNYINFVNSEIQKVNNTPPSIISTHQATLNTYISKTNTALQNLLSIKNEIQTNKDAFNSSDLDTQSSQLSIIQKENTLKDAKDNLKYYTIYAPFSGIISSVPIQKSQTVNSGTVLGNIITNNQTAVVSLNEVDIAKIQLGDKATVTFDAIPNLSITGKVTEIDSVGTVSQGVVNYNIKISFDTNDSKIKPGMSVNASIITGIKQNVLTVPNSAVKIQNGENYVEMFDTTLPTPIAGTQGSISITPPRQQPVVIGVSNDTMTEIISGLKDGDAVVTRKIIPTTTTTNTAPSILGNTTNRSGGNAARVPTGR